MLVLQDAMELVKVEPGSCSETCPTSSLVGNELTGVKVEKVTYVTEKEGLEPMTSAEIKAEPEVSYSRTSIIWANDWLLLAG
jgi:flavoprotein